MFQMGKDKFLRSDGMTAEVYQKGWKFMKNEVTSAVLDVLYFENIFRFLNVIYIILILKINNVEKVEDIRSISLCNVIY